jgi:hypothetical protein
MTNSEKIQVVRDFNTAVIRRGNWRGCTHGINDRMRYDVCADCPGREDCAPHAGRTVLIERVRITRDRVRALHGFTN